MFKLKPNKKCIQKPITSDNRPKVLDSFWKRVEDVSYHTDEDCWLWIGHRDKDGYGKMCINFGVYPAHRVSWLLYRGDLNNLQVLHKCDSPSCINPSHLFLGTQQDNMTDKVSKGRHLNVARGELSGASKLTEAQARKIKYEWRHVRAKAVAKTFFITTEQVQQIRRGSRWKHI